MAQYTITLRTPDGEHELECDEDDSILDTAEDEGMELPWGCRSGSCASCTGRLTSGRVDQEEQMILDDEQIEDGFVLLCVAKPLSDCTIRTHQHDEL